MSLATLTLPGLVSLQSQQFAAQSDLDIRDDQGEPLNDIWGATALCGLQIKAQVAFVQGVTRLVSSSGINVDTFVNCFGIYRDSASPAVGTLTVTQPSISPTDTIIPFGSTAQTQDGSLQFSVVSDPTQTAWTEAGYVIPAGTSGSINVTVSCQKAGSVGNVSANTITSLVSGLGSVPLGSLSVTNPQGFDDGVDGETDAALILRFSQEFQSGRFATRLAILTAIAATQSNLTYQIGEGVNASGTATPGHFVVFANVVGSNAAAPSTLLTTIYNAILNVKACGITYEVVSPSQSVVNAAATFSIDPVWLALPGNTTALFLANAQQAYDNYVNSIGLNVNNSSTLLSYAKVSAVLVTVPGALNVSSFTLNGGTADLTANFGVQFVAGTATFTHT